MKKPSFPISFYLKVLQYLNNIKGDFKNELNVQCSRVKYLNAVKLKLVLSLGFKHDLGLVSS